MSAGQQIIRVPVPCDPWGARHRQGNNEGFTARSGRTLEDLSSDPGRFRPYGSVNTSDTPIWAMPRYRDPDGWRRPDGAVEKHGPTVAHLARAVAILTGVSREEIIGRSRKIGACKARHILAWLIQARTKRSLPSIGAFLGDRDHTSALNSIYRVKDALVALEIDPETDSLTLIEALWAGKWPDKRREVPQ